MKDRANLARLFASTARSALFLPQHNQYSSTRHTTVFAKRYSSYSRNSGFTQSQTCFPSLDSISASTAARRLWALKHSSTKTWRNQGSSSTKGLLSLGFGGVGLSAVGVWLHGTSDDFFTTLQRRILPFAICETSISKVKPSLRTNEIKAETSKTEEKWSILLSLMLKDWKFYFLATLSSILSSLCTSAQATVFGHIFDIVGVGSDISLLYPSVRKLLSLFVFSSLFSFFSNLSLALASNNLGNTLRRLYYKKVLQLDVEYFDENKSSKLAHELSHDVSQLQSSIRLSFTRGIESVTGLLSGFCYMYLTSKTVTLTLLGVLPPLTVFANSLGYFLRHLSAELNRLQGETSALANETFSNIKTVRAFHGEEIEEMIFEEQLEKVSEVKKLLAFSSSVFYVCLTLGINLIALGTIFLGGYLVQNNEMTKGDIAAIVTQTQIIERSFARLSLLVSQLSRAVKNADNIFTVLNLKSKVELIDAEFVNEQALLRIPLKQESDASSTEVEFKAVFFEYPSRPEITVLKDFNLKIKKGEVVALAGPSGSGKSTTFSLLQKFYHPSKGDVLIDGQNVKSLPLSELHKVISIVSQEPVLFARTIRENIKYGKQEATEEEVIEAAKKANAHEFIDDFPQGYDTMLGERGALLSGGQKQRIAIARAILANSKILLLDEATSALDNRSEKKVQQALEELMKGRTTIVIAHRLSTIRDADKIYVIDRGQVVESGTHDELLVKSNGRYSSLFKTQFKTQEAE